MKLFFIWIVSFVLISSGHAQFAKNVFTPDSTNITTVDSAYEMSLTITAHDLYEDLSVYASDGFEGRELGTKANDKAVDFIEKQIVALNIAPCNIENDTPSYRQAVAFTWIYWNNISLKVKGKKKEKKYRHLWDFVSLPAQNRNMPFLSTDEVIFMGYGIEDELYSDYKKANVRNKVIMIYKGEPVDKEGNSRITGSSKSSIWADSIDLKLKVAYKHGVKLVLIIDDNVKKTIAKNRKTLISPKVIQGDVEKLIGDRANSMYISTSIAKKIIGKKFKKVVKARKCIEKRGKLRPVKLKCDLKIQQEQTIRSLKGDNIVAYFEGTENPDELLVLSAHLDHIGKKGIDINNGADDNGSGTCTLLEIAEALALARDKGIYPKRSILCLWVNGEEKGLLGSNYYVNHPVFPLNHTFANINMDMVGRVDKKYKDNPNYIYVIGSDRLSKDLHRINEQVDSKYTNLVMDYKYNAKSDPNRYYYRSDHYNFAKMGIPAIFFFNGTHADYHRPTDTVEKINFDKMETIARHIFLLAWDLANREERLSKD